MLVRHPFAAARCTALISSGTIWVSSAQARRTEATGGLSSLSPDERGESGGKRLDESQTREAELINMGNFQTQAATKQSSSASVGVWDVLDRYVDPSAVTKQKWSDYLVSIAPQAGSPYPDLNDLY